MGRASRQLWFARAGAMRYVGSPNLEPSVNRSSFLRLAAIGICTALAVAGCGRKGSLDPPPGATAADVSQQAEEGARIGVVAQPVPIGGERPVAPVGPQRRIPLDWLID